MGRTKDLVEIFEANERRWRSGRHVAVDLADDDLTDPAGPWDTTDLLDDVADDDLDEADERDDDEGAAEARG